MDYAKYLKETQRLETIETSFGFITYQVCGAVCIIHDLYIVPSHRGTVGLADSLANEVQKSITGCNLLAAEVYKGNPAWKANVRRFKKYGFEVEAEDWNVVILRKRI